MIAPASPVRRRKPAPGWHSRFLAMLPEIREYARYEFRKLKPEAREDAVEEIVCAACAAFARLAAQGKLHAAYPSALVRFAAKQFRSGRRLGCKLNIKDLSSDHCRLQKHIALDRLDRWDREEGQWIEVLVEDHRAGPAATAAARIDVGDWFQRMGPRDRRMAQALAVGERTTDVAKRFGISPARVSQKRWEFRSNWEKFQSERHGEEEAAPATA